MDTTLTATPIEVCENTLCLDWVAQAQVGSCGLGTIGIDLTLRRDVQDEFSTSGLDSHDSQSTRCDLQPNDFEQILCLGGQASETIEQLVANKRDLVFVSSAR